MGYNRKQLAKVHSELRAREKSSLARLEKALMERDSEPETKIGLSQKKEMVEEEMFEAFMAEHTFLVEKPVVTDHSKDEVPESCKEDASELPEQGGQ